MGEDDAKSKTKSNCHQKSKNSMPKVKVSEGWLEGEILDLITGDGQYCSFKGIPYAAPPVGKLRFKAPQPPLPWDGVRKATAHGPNCTQMDMFSQQIIPGSEDCLFLNVYTRDLNPETPLPVMIFIHGGGFMSGSGDVTYYGPDFLVDHGVVLVTFNYRLEALGFLCLDTEEVPGNAGLKDQVAALKWVNKNISCFGGDPNNVTVFGESAGGAAAAHHVLSPLSKGLFKRVISMSGVPNCDWAIAFRPRQRAFVLGKQLGKETDDPDELLEFLQSVPADKLVDLSPAVLKSEELIKDGVKMYHFTPVVEKDFGQEHFLTESPLEVLRKGKANEVDLLIGNTSEEALYGADPAHLSILEKHYRYPEIMVPRELTIQCSPSTVLEVAEKIQKYYFKSDQAAMEILSKFIRYSTEPSFMYYMQRFVSKMPKMVSEKIYKVYLEKNQLGIQAIKDFLKYMSETSLIYDIHRFVSKMPQNGKNKLYLYVFSCESERNIYGNKAATFGLHGVAHMDDVMYLFAPQFLGSKIDKSSKEYKLIQLVTTSFTNFAKYGTPTPDQSLGIIWPEYENSTKKYVDIGNQLVIGSNYKGEEIAFWKGIYEQAGVAF